MLYVDGFFHGDAHPGNVFILPDQRIALVDFGMVGRLTSDMREKVVDIVFAVMREDLAAVARIFFELGRPEGRVNYAAYENEVIETLEQEVVGKPLSEIQVGTLFMKICEGAIKYRIRIPADFTMMFKAMVTAEGLAKMIAPDINVIEEARPYIVRMVAERYSVKRLRQEIVGDLRRVLRFVRGVPMAGSEIMRQLQEGELHLSVSVEHLRPLALNHVRAQNRTQLALVFAAATLSGTLALADTHFTYGGLPVLSLTFYGLAIAALMVMFLSLLRSRL
jgi:ubiquinone biosynthesis protein